MSEQKTIEQTCANCAMWRENPQPPGGAVLLGQPKRGTCYLLPPVPFLQLDKHTGQPIGQGHARPMPLETEGCGMFVGKDTALPH